MYCAIQGNASAPLGGCSNKGARQKLDASMNLKYSNVFVMLALATAFTGCGGDEPPEADLVRPIRVMQVGDLEAMGERSFPGRAQAAQEVDLSFRVTGPLIARAVNVGDEVQEGDLIARMDPRDFEVRVRETEGTLQRALANEQRARADFERNLSIQREDAGAISQAAIDRSKEALDLARADIAALEAALDGAKDDLNDTQLQAPFAGTIVSTFVESFEFVQARQPIVRLLNKERIEFVINIPETLISLVEHVEGIEVEFDAFRGVRIPAEISEVGTEASETTRTFPVTVIMDQPERVRILPGMAGRGTAQVRQPDAADQVDIIIPVTSVISREIEGSSYVWVVDESTNTVSRREVEIEALISSGLVVKTGLEVGETIATAGVHFLTEGQQVRPAIE